MPKRKQVQSGKSPFSLRLASLRKEHGLNMDTLAQQVGVSKSYISLLESGGAPAFPRGGTQTRFGPLSRCG